MPLNNGHSICVICHWYCPIRRERLPLLLNDFHCLCCGSAVTLRPCYLHSIVPFTFVALVVVVVFRSPNRGFIASLAYPRTAQWYHHVPVSLSISGCDTAYLPSLNNLYPVQSILKNFRRQMSSLTQYRDLSVRSSLVQSIPDERACPSMQRGCTRLST